MCKKILINVLDWTWCLPQNLVGLLFHLFVTVYCKYELHSDNVIICDCNLKSGSVTLGKFIFLGECHWNDPNVLDHETGHAIQSRILGPLYLFVIGIPSLIWANCFGKWRVKHKKSYYWFYTEKWANKLMDLDLK